MIKHKDILSSEARTLNLKTNAFLVKVNNKILKKSLTLSDAFYLVRAKKIIEYYKAKKENKELTNRCSELALLSCKFGWLFSLYKKRKDFKVANYLEDFDQVTDQNGILKIRDKGAHLYSFFVYYHTRTKESCLEEGGLCIYLCDSIFNKKISYNHQLYSVPYALQCNALYLGRQKPKLDTSQLNEIVRACLPISSLIVKQGVMPFQHFSQPLFSDLVAKLKEAILSTPSNLLTSLRPSILFVLYKTFSFYSDWNFCYQLRSFYKKSLEAAHDEFKNDLELSLLEDSNFESFDHINPSINSRNYSLILKNRLSDFLKTNSNSETPQNSIRKYFEGKNVAIVGPSNISNPEGGSIDANDVVIRLNFNIFQQYYLDGEHALKYGRKTNCIVLNNGLGKKLSILEASLGQNLNDILFLFKNKSHSCRYNPYSSHSVNNFLLSEPEPNGLINIIYTLLFCGCKKIEIFGCDFYAGAKPYSEAHISALSKVGFSLNHWNYGEGFKFHDQISNFIFVKRCYELGYVSIDNCGKTILGLTVGQYVSRLAHLFPPLYSNQK